MLRYLRHRLVRRTGLVSHRSENISCIFVPCVYCLIDCFDRQFVEVAKVSNMFHFGWPLCHNSETPNMLGSLTSMVGSAVALTFRAVNSVKWRKSPYYDNPDSAEIGDLATDEEESQDKRGRSRGN